MDKYFRHDTDDIYVLDESLILLLDLNPLIHLNGDRTQCSRQRTIWAFLVMSLSLPYEWPYYRYPSFIARLENYVLVADHHLSGDPYRCLASTSRSTCCWPPETRPLTHQLLRMGHYCFATSRRTRIKKKNICIIRQGSWLQS